MITEKKYTIFLVEDDELYAELLIVKLQSTVNSNIIRFNNGEEMLRHIESKKSSPDIILLDYYLESDEEFNMSGLDVFRNLPSNLSNVPVVLISGSTDYSLVGASLKMGVYDFIHKNENTFERLENVILKMAETLRLKQDLLAINNNSLRIQKIAGIAVITIIALISLLGYNY